MKVVEDKYNSLMSQKTTLLDQQVNSFKNAIYLINSNVKFLFSLDKYDADHSVWSAEILDKGVKYKVSININPTEARLLWSNINQLKVYEIKKPFNLSRSLVILYADNTNPIQLQSYKYEKSYDANGELIFSRVEVDASFPGGLGAWTRFIANNLESNLPGENGASPGKYTVTVRFIVNKDGQVSDVQAETNHGYGMEQEAIRVIKKSGRWTPAIQNGRNVTAYKRQPMTWIVSE